MPITIHLDTWLTRRKMRSRELAEIVGITDANLSILKTGKAKAVRFSTLEAICEALGCQPGDLLEYVPEYMESELFTEARSFLDQLFYELDQAGLDLRTNELDHLCYRVESLERYREMKHSLLGEGHRLLSENTINNRPIAAFELANPIPYKGRNIYCLELPAPKTSSPYPEGFEHAEFVIDESFRAFQQKYPSIVFDTRGVEKAHNPELRLSFGTLNVKFHHKSLMELIKEEN
jgi:DNA-binding Xre family transcriptional regulator/predicted metalloenzyme YecM